MKIRSLQVVNVRWYNATAWYGASLAQCLNADGHPSLVVALPESPPLLQAQKMGLECYALSLNSKLPWQWPALYLQMQEIVKKFKPHVVNCHRGEAFPLWATLKQKHGFALVRTRGDQRLPRNNAPNRLLYRQVADAIIATNSPMAQHLIHKLGVNPAKVHTILGGVDTHIFHPMNAESPQDGDTRQQLRASFGFGPQDVVIGLVGRLDPVKGIHSCLEALALAKKQPGGKDLKFLLVAFSSQHTEAEVLQWAETLGLADSVRITGKVANVTSYIQAMDAGVLASLGSETIARAALEIMACNIPLFSSRVGVMPDLLPQDFLFTPGNAHEMAHFFLQACQKEWRQHLRKLCLDRIQTLRLQDFRDQTLEIYDSLGGLSPARA